SSRCPWTPIRKRAASRHPTSRPAAIPRPGPTRWSPMGACICAIKTCCGATMLPRPRKEGDRRIRKEFGGANRNLDSGAWLREPPLVRHAGGLGPGLAVAVKAVENRQKIGREQQRRQHAADDDDGEGPLGLGADL